MCFLSIHEAIGCIFDQKVSTHGNMSTKGVSIQGSMDCIKKTNRVHGT